MKRHTSKAIRYILLAVLFITMTMIPASARYIGQTLLNYKKNSVNVITPDNVGFDIVFTAPVLVTPGQHGVVGDNVSGAVGKNNTGAELRIKDCPAGWYAFFCRGARGGDGNALDIVVGGTGYGGYGGYGAAVQGAWYFSGGDIVIRAGKGGANRPNDGNNDQGHAEWNGGKSYGKAGGGGGYSGIFAGAAGFTPGTTNTVAIAGGGGGGGLGGSNAEGTSDGGNGGNGYGGAAAAWGVGGNGTAGYTSGTTWTGVAGTGAGRIGSGGGGGGSGGGDVKAFIGSSSRYGGTPGCAANGAYRRNTATWTSHTPYVKDGNTAATAWIGGGGGGGGGGGDGKSSDDRTNQAGGNGGYDGSGTSGQAIGKDGGNGVQWTGGRGGDNSGGGGGGGWYGGGGGGYNRGGSGGGGGGSSYLAASIRAIGSSPVGSSLPKGWSDLFPDSLLTSGTGSTAPADIALSSGKTHDGNSRNAANGYVWLCYLGARWPGDATDAWVFD